MSPYRWRPHLRAPSLGDGFVRGLVVGLAVGFALAWLVGLVWP